LVKGFEDEGPINDWKIRCLVLSGQEVSLITNLSEEKDIEIVYGDVAKRETLKYAVRDMDIIFHIGGIIHPKKIEDLYWVNTFGTFIYNLLKIYAIH